MLKQVYRFLSIFLAYNLLFIPVCVAKTKKPVNNVKPVTSGSTNQGVQKPNINSVNSNNTQINPNYISRYGVLPLNNVQNTYTSPQTKTGN